jgi:hypothetical protein
MHEGWSGVHICDASHVVCVVCAVVQGAVQQVVPCTCRVCIGFNIWGSTDGVLYGLPIMEAYPSIQQLVSAMACVLLGGPMGSVLHPYCSC